MGMAMGRHLNCSMTFCECIKMVVKKLDSVYLLIYVCSDWILFKNSALLSVSNTLRAIAMLVQTGGDTSVGVKRQTA